jgi:nitroreductase
MFLALAQKRRSIRKYIDKEVETEKIDSMVEAVLRAPTSRGKKPWEFVVVTDPGLLEKLSDAKPHGAKFLKNAALGIVVCANPQISLTAEAYIAKVLNLAAHIKVLSIIAIGYSAESKSAHPKEHLPYDNISLNNYGTPYSTGL